MRDTTRHEIGHTICEKFNIETSNGMKKAYIQDLAQMPEKTKKELFYYIQESTPDIGLSEACAESYAASISSADVMADSTKPRGFVQNFPNTIKYVKESQYFTADFNDANQTSQNMY